MMRTMLTGCAAALFILTLTPHATAATIQASSCSHTAVQTAINSANNGDTVTIPAGTCTWTATVTIPATKGITLQGAGAGTTVISNGLSSFVRLLDINVAAGNALTRVTGFTVDARLTAGTSLGEQILVNGLGVDSFRVDHLRIQNIRLRGIVVVATNGGELSGLIDNNVFDVLATTAATASTSSPRGPAAAPRSRSTLRLPVRSSLDRTSRFTLKTTSSILRTRTMGRSTGLAAFRSSFAITP